MHEADDDPWWLQKIIACALHIGIGKRELFEEYYIDEIAGVLSAYTAIGTEEKQDIAYVDFDHFFGF